MREILFRGKRKDNGKWTSGYLFLMWGTAYICWGMINGVPNMEEVVPETVGQYTGLTDKNGSKIFEGDIIRTTNPYTGEVYVGVVEWGCYYAFGVGFVIAWNADDNNDLNPSLFYWVSDVGVEVVGNAYDNPELLENKNLEEHENG